MTGLGSFYTATVVEYFSSAPNPSEIEKISNKYNLLRIPILRPERLASMPPGSIFAKMIDNEDQNDVMVFYPVFPHLNMPVKAGEQVIVIYGSAQKGDRIGYWLSRKPSDLVAEDVNYTHNDRSNFGSSRQAGPGIAAAKKFPDNGLAGISYETVFQNSDTIKNDFQGEPVPRYYVKSPDTSIQGSNNTLIVLGSNTTLNKEKTPRAGLIDLVVGRGQTPDTGPLKTFTNTRSYDEVDKASERNANEGNLDLINDLSRINISTGLNVDSDFSVGAGDNSGAAPAVVLKTDQIRLLARQDLKIVVGSGDDQSSILIKNDGNIVITPGGQIKLSGESDDQAYLRYDQFNQIVQKLLDISAALQSSLGPTAASVGPAAAVAIAAGTPLTETAVNDLSSAINVTRFSEIGLASADVATLLETIKSTKIIGS